jgi:pyruvate kinase
LRSRKGLAVSGKYIPTPLLTDRDKDFVKLARKNLIWYFALSFVQKAEDIDSFREFAKENGIPDPFIIAKIETMVGVSNLEAIAEKADIVMIARGDLMIDTGIPNFGPIVDGMTQKLKELNKPFIVATEVIESMRNNPSPTRADVMNVYQAKKDGAWGVMCSAETAMGDFPIETVQTLRDILDFPEES